jgi:hypothetical protein
MRNSNLMCITLIWGKSQGLCQPVLSLGVTNPIGRFGGSGGVVSSRSASKTRLSGLRVLRLKVSFEVANCDLQADTHRP